MNPVRSPNTSPRRSRHSMNFAGETLVPKAEPSRRIWSWTMRSGSGNGTGFRTTALTTEKIAVVVPMPSAIAATAVTANTGLVRNTRNACLRSSRNLVTTFSWAAHSFVAQRLERMDAARAPRRDPHGCETRCREPDRHPDEHHDIARLDAVQHVREERGQEERPDETDDDADADERHALPHDVPAHLVGLRAERHANADLLRAVLHRVRHEAVNADRGE